MAYGAEHAPADFSGLAARAVGGMDGAACVIATRDGLALGAFPAGEEARILSRWAELGPGATAALRGFLVLNGQAWVIATTRRYVGVAVVPSATRPGLMLQQLEAALEESEVGGEVPERPPAPFHTIRTPTAPQQRQAPQDHRVSPNHPTRQDPQPMAPQDSEVSPDLLEVAKVLGRLAGPSPEPPPEDRWSVPRTAGTIGT